MTVSMAPGGANAQTGFNPSTLRSWEFIALVVSNVAMWFATAGETVQTHDAYIFTAVSAGLYALARGFAKQNSDPRDAWKTTEFYVAILGALTAAVGGFKGHISGTTETQLIALLTGLSSIANGLRTPPVTPAASIVAPSPTPPTSRPSGTSPRSG
jgi:hypothetical protein